MSKVVRSPQGRPIVIQAGGSDKTIEMGGRIADVIFTAQADLEMAIEFRAAVRHSAERQGRPPDSIKVMPGLSVFIGETREEAWAKFNALHDMVDVKDAVEGLGRLLGGLDLSGYDPHAPMPATVPDSAEAPAITSASDAPSTASVCQPYQRCSTAALGSSDGASAMGT